jgi:TP901 family phage tail tape measure protein
MAQEVQIRATERGFAQVGASFNRLQGHVRGLKSSMLSLGAGLGAGIGAASLVKSVVDVDAAITRLVIASGKGPEAIAKLQAQVRAASTATGKSTSDLVAGMHKIVEITGDYDLASGSIEALGRISSATGAGIEDVAAAAAELGQKMQIRPEGIERVFNILATQGKAGSFELRNMAAGFPALLSSLSAFGVKGEEGIRTFGAFLQIARRGFGSAEQTTTGVAALMASLRSDKVQKRLGAIGIKNVGQTNPVETLMKLVQKTGGDATKISKVLGGRHEAQAALLPLGKMFRDTKGFGEMSKLSGVQDLGAISKDFATWMGSAAGQIEKAKNEMENVALDKLSAGLRGLAKHGDVLVQGINWVGDNMLLVGSALMGLKMSGKLRGILGGMATAAAAGAEAGGGRGRDEFGRFTSLPPTLESTKRLASFSQSVANAGGALNALSSVLAAGALGYSIGTLIDQTFKLSDAISEGLFDILHPGERARRAEVRAKEKIETQYRQGEAQYGMTKREEASGGMLEHARRYVRSGAGGRGARGSRMTDIATEGLTKDARAAGYSEAAIAMLVPVLMRAAKAMEKGTKIDLSLEGLLGLSEPTRKAARGSRQGGG